MGTLEVRGGERIQPNTKMCPQRTHFRVRLEGGRWRRGRYHQTPKTHLFMCILSVWWGGNTAWHENRSSVDTFWCQAGGRKLEGRTRHHQHVQVDTLVVFGGEGMQPDTKMHPHMVVFLCRAGRRGLGGPQTRKMCLVWHVFYVWLTREGLREKGCRRSGDTAGEGREGYISIKYIVLILKKEPFMHPSLCCRVWCPFPRMGCWWGILVMPCGVMDVLWVVEEVLGDGGQRGTWLWWVWGKEGGHWCGNIHIWPFVACSKLGNRWNWRKCGVLGLSGPFLRRFRWSKCWFEGTLF